MVGLLALAMGGCSKPDAAPVPESSPSPAPRVQTEVVPLVPGTVLNNLIIGGRPVAEAVVLSVSDSGISVRCDRSIANVPFSSLPSDVAARARMQLAKTPNYRPTVAKVAQPAKTSAGSAVAAANGPSSVASRPAAPDPEAQRMQALRDFAHTEATRCVKKEFSSGNGDFVAGISIDDIAPMSGWDGQFRVNGRVRLLVRGGTRTSQERSRGFELMIRQSSGSGRFEHVSFLMSPGYSR